MKRHILLIIPLLMVQHISAQTLSPTGISSTGGFYSNTTGMLSSTAGEMTMVETFSSPGNFLTQGFQQPEDFGVGIDELSAGQNVIIIYPNPAAEFFTLEADFKERGTIVYSVFDAIGQLVISESQLKTQHGKISEPVDVKTLSAGIYFVKVDFTSAAQQGKNIALKLTIVK